MITFTADHTASLRAALLAWFDRHKRDLPWRRTRDPYAIWVSEVMLQQTQVSRVEGYWTRFLQRFPTARALAEAPLDDVLAAWSGLGYYSRARNLHRAARQIVEAHGGQLPRTSEQLRGLSGFGRYTAGAVASIAFGEPAPVVDGNVARVLSRLDAIDGAPGDRAREARLWARAGELAQGERPGDLNQALMELGATLCKPVGPTCLLCPWRDACAARAQGREEQLPPPKARPKRTKLEVAAAWCERQGRILLSQRPGRGLFGGLWEMPSVEGGDGEALRKLFDPPAGASTHLGTVHRTLTHRELRIDVYALELPAKAALREGKGARWVAKTELDALGVSSATRKALALGLGDAVRERSPGR
ncbi:MAG TPA: A/G-specific adenine glycosylase [Myxococcaceae bacterium]|nr:A/G-specific adenine glycosylase [Myxococcaceae bacterium]